MAPHRIILNRESVSRTVINLSGSKSAYQAWTYSDLTVTIPANSIFELIATDVWAHAEPLGVAIQTYMQKTPDERPFETCAMGAGTTSYGGYVDSATVFYVYVKNSGSGVNPVYLRGWYMPAS